VPEKTHEIYFFGHREKKAKKTIKRRKKTQTSQGGREGTTLNVNSFTMHTNKD
jgi:hypothetical protein